MLLRVLVAYIAWSINVRSASTISSRLFTYQELITIIRVAHIAIHTLTKRYLILIFGRLSVFFQCHVFP
jgi:hypothetical protein